MSRRPTLTAWLWFALAMAPGTVLLASRLGLDLWYDEVYTIYKSVAPSLSKAVTTYDSPNNHVLYSILLRPWYWMYLVTDAEWWLRLPSFLCSLATLALVFEIGRRWACLAVGVLSTLLLGMTQMFLVYGIQVRGYALSMLLCTALAFLALSSSESRGWWRHVGIVLCGAALLYVMPSNVLLLGPLSIVAVVLVWSGQRKVGAVVTECVWWCAPWALAALLYAPIARDVISAAGSDTHLWRPKTALYRAAVFYRSATADMGIMILALPIGPFVWLRKRPWEDWRTKFALPLVIATMVVGPFILSAVSGIVPFSRNFCGVLPFVALAIGFLMVEISELVFSRQGREVPTWMLIAPGVVLLGLITVPRLASYPERLAEYRRVVPASDGYLNYYAADFEPSAVAEALRSQLAAAGPEPYVICYPQSEHYNLVHYLVAAELPLDSGGGEQDDNRPVRVYYVEPAAPVSDERFTCHGFSRTMLESLPVVETMGYYRLHRSPELVTPANAN